MLIYVIVCSESLKIYVGQHKHDNLGKYLSKKFYDAHRYSEKRSHLYAAMRKYPREVWSIHPLVSGVVDRQALDELERHYIRVLKTQHPDVGYNICEGGEGFTGPHAEETKRQISARMHIVMIGNDHGKGIAGHSYPKSPEWRRRVSAKMKGIPKSAATIQHMREAQQVRRAREK